MDIKDLITESQYKELYNDYLHYFKDTDITFYEFLTKVYKINLDKKSQ